MSSEFTYTGDLSQPLQLTRFLIADKDPEDFVYTDQEINGILALPSVLNDAECAAICILGQKLAELAQCVEQSMGDYKVEFKKQYDMTKTTLEQLRIKKYGDKDGTDCMFLDSPEPTDPVYNTGSCCYPNATVQNQVPTFFKGSIDTNPNYGCPKCGNGDCCC